MTLNKHSRSRRLYTVNIYCPRGSDELYLVRPGFFFSVRTITHEPLHLLDDILHEHVP